MNSTPTFSPDGKLLAVGGSTVRLFESASGKEIASLDGMRNVITALGFSSDGKHVAAGSSDGTIVVWEWR